MSYYFILSESDVLRQFLTLLLATILPLKSKLPGKLQCFNAINVSRCWKINEFPKLPIKRNNSKAFCETQTASRLKEVIQQIKPDKSLLLLWNKNFLRKIYGNILIIAFKVLQECISWASRNDAAPVFFLTPIRWLLKDL